MSFSLMLMFVFFSFSIFASLEPLSDSAHTLGVIDDAMDQLDALRGESLIDADGRDVKPEHFDITFDGVSFGYDSLPFAVCWPGSTIPSPATSPWAATA